MMHRFWGWFVLAGVLYLTYEFVGRLGAGTLVDLLESGLFDKYINPAFVKAVEFLLPWSSLKIVRDALVGEYGMLTVAVTYAVAIILPIVSTFFIVFGILEDSGYLPRLAVMSNQLFKRIGLNGKAVLPMVLGLGCGTMAALTSRIMETRKERILVILLLALGVPCSAQLGVILGVLHDVGMLGGIIWFAVVVGVMMLVGYIAEKIIPGEEADFVLELPPVRVPQLSNIVIKTLARIEWYVKEAVPLFILGTFVLFVLDKSGVLKHIEAFASPVVQGWLDLPAKATEAFIVGFLRRDYGAAGLYALRENGMLDNIGVVVGMITITLFIPCIANFFMIIKELGLKAALLVGAFIFPFAFLVGGLVNLILRGFHVGI
jgi:ferrous iron transport protein B